MEPEEHESSPFDWRRWTPIAASNKSAFQPLSIQVMGAHGNAVLVAVPSVTALNWSIAFQAHRRALDSRSALDHTLAVGRADELAYSYIEDIMASVMFSVASLEAFANTAIHQAPNAPYYGPKACYNDWYKPPEPNPKDAPRSWSREKAEKDLSLAKKLGDVLPFMMKMPSSPLQDRPLWQDYRDLQELRNKCVQHAHTWDRTTEAFWVDLLQPKPANYPEIAAKMIQFFVGNNPDYWVNRRPKD